jgi:hypothetical protein
MDFMALLTHYAEGLRENRSADLAGPVRRGVEDLGTLVADSIIDRDQHFFRRPHSTRRRFN